MLVVFEKTFGFVYSIYPLSSGVTTRDLSAYPASTHSEFTIPDDAGVLTDFGGGSIFRVDNVVTPTVVIEVIRTQLIVNSPSSWTSGIDNKVFVDDGANNEQQDVIVTGIHPDCDDLIITLIQLETGTQILIDTERDGSSIYYTWDLLDSFVTVNLVFDNESMVGAWSIMVMNKGLAKFNLDNAENYLFQVVRRPLNMNQEISMVESTDGARTAFTFSGSKEATRGTLQVYTDRGGRTRQRLFPSEFTETLTADKVTGITITTPPETGDVITVLAERYAKEDTALSLNGQPIGGGPSGGFPPGKTIP